MPEGEVKVVAIKQLEKKALQNYTVKLEVNYRANLMDNAASVRRLAPKYRRGFGQGPVNLLASIAEAGALQSA